MQTGENIDELWDVYDKDRQKTGRTHKRGEELKDGDYHLVVHVCIFNSKNELLIQQRQPFKKGWPNMWDLTVGGSAVCGDSSSEAAEREVFEELGIKIDLSGKRPNFTTYFSVGINDIYIVEKDIELSELKLQKEEVKAAKWASREEIRRMQEEGTMIPYWYLDKLFEFKDFYNERGDRRQNIRVDFATRKNLNAWMDFVEVVKWNFPGLETEEKVAEYRKTVIKNIERGTAICALNHNMVIGILLFSTKYNMLCCMAVHPEYRKQGIGRKMVELMLTKLDRSCDIVVETFREEDEKGIAPRAFYRSLGFIPGELGEFEGYPQQWFVLKGEK